MKKLLLLLVLCLAPVFGQDGTLTDSIYWASKDPRIVALQQLPPASGARNDAAAALDKAGLIIDRAVDVWGWDPTILMNYRKSLGYPWLPNAFQPDLVDPLHTGVVPAGQQPTDMSKPWARSIKVSTDAKDYPPFTPPAPKPAYDGITTNFDPAIGVYTVNPAAVTGPDGKWIFQEGQSLLYKEQKVTFHLSYSIFGANPEFIVVK